MTDAPGRRPRIRGARRLALGAGLTALLAAFVGVWALPNVAGAAFVEVGALVAPRPSAAGPTITLAGRAPVQASSIELGIEVVNHYPLGVVLGVDASAFRAAVYHRDATGHLVRFWQAVLDDPTLEEGSDSPAGGGGHGAAVVPPGTSRHALTGPGTAFSLLDASGAPLPAGVYYVRVWAYGIGSGLVPIALDGATDPLGMPAAGDAAPPSDAPVNFR